MCRRFLFRIVTSCCAEYYFTEVARQREYASLCCSLKPVVVYESGAGFVVEAEGRKNGVCRWWCLLISRERVTVRMVGSGGMGLDGGEY